MNELCSKIHTPPGILSGLYEPDIMRVCVLVHDSSVTASCHVPTMFKQVSYVCYGWCVCIYVGVGVYMYMWIGCVYVGVYNTVYIPAHIHLYM